MKNLKKIFLLVALIFIVSGCESSDLASENDDQQGKLLKTQEMIDFEKTLIDYGNTISERPLSKEETAKVLRNKIIDYISINDLQEAENKTDGQLLVEALNQHAQNLRELNSPK